LFHGSPQNFIYYKSNPFDEHSILARGVLQLYAKMQTSRYSQTLNRT